MKSIIRSLVVLVIMAAVIVWLHPVDVSAKTVYNLEPGDSFNFTEKKDYKKHGAILVVIDKPGTYYLRGSQSMSDMVYNSMLKIDPPKNTTITVYLDNVKLAPNDDAPGDVDDRSAIEICDGGGTVRLISKNEGNIFEGQGRYPAIRKDNTNTKLIFDSDGTGVIKASADKGAFRTCAIGCYSPNIEFLSAAWANTTGNIIFESGTIRAFGSTQYSKNSALVPFDQLDGGAAIGAGGYGSVDGITINGGTIYAQAGDITAAAIGTSSAVWTTPYIDYPTYGSKAKNIIINGGTIHTSHANNHSDLHIKEGNCNSGHGAGIGGGYRTDVENLKINGGKIRINVPNTNGSPYDTKHLPAVGIGAGQEGNADIEINGEPDIEIWCDEVGIGAHAYRETDYDIKLYPEQPDDPKNYGWFGDARVKISGNPKIKIESWGVCIGGSKKDSKHGFVEINGGQLDLHSRHAAKIPVIGPHNRGKLKRITITGGIIKAHKDFINGDSAVIGNKYYSDTSDHINDSSYVDKIEITGGTVLCTQGDRTRPSIGKIGANKGADYDMSHADVMISGGNVCANRLNGSKSQPYSSLESGKKTPVYCRVISTVSGDSLINESTAVTDGDIPLKHKDGTEYQYGLKDVVTNVVQNDIGQLYFWTPEDSDMGRITLEKSPFEEIDSTDYYGQLKYDEDIKTYHFYPPLPIKLLVGDAPSDTGEDGSAKAIVGDTKLLEFDRPTGNTSLIEKYNTKPDGTGTDVLTRAGAFIQSEDKDYIDDEGRWVFTGGKNGLPELSYFLYGLKLYAQTSDEKLGISYDPNIPAKTASTLNGSMPAEQEYDYDQKIVFPDDSGFWLNGYRFKGWNSSPDGSGTDYSHDQDDVYARDILDLADHSEVILYACWEPIKYNVNYASQDPALPSVAFEYTYDESKNVPWIDDLQDWGVQQEQLAGWSYDGSRYGRNDELLNFVDFDNKGKIKERTMNAVWTKKGEVQIRVSLDGEGVEGLADDILIVSEEGTELEQYFSPEENVPGAYKKKEDKELPDGTYTVRIGDRRLDEDASSFSYSSESSVYLELASYTVTIDGDDRISSVTLSPEDGKDSKGRSYVIAPKGYEIEIDAACADNTGYHSSGWKYTGHEPEWDSSKVEQTAKVTGTALITAVSEGNRYTVVYDANGGTGEMDPQEFRVGEPQKLSKSTMKRAGFYQGVLNENYYWSLSEGYYGSRTLTDEELISDYPLTYEDGAEVKLYAQWRPADYEVTFVENANGSIDPSQASGVTHGISYKYDGTGTLPKQEDIIRDSWDRWTYQNEYELFGWQEANNEDAPILKPGESFKNLCSIDEDGKIVGMHMSALWIRKATLAVFARVDRKGITGLADKIILTDEDGRVYGDLFDETPGIPGRYTCSDDLAAGRYKVSIDGYPLPEEESVFDYDPNGDNELTYDYYSITMKNEDHATNATVTVPGGEPAESAVVFGGTEVEIDASTDDGYGFGAWTWPEDENSPEWESGKDETFANQIITVREKMELTAHGEGYAYRIVFDPNDPEYPEADAATGTMNDQYMVCGKPEKLYKNEFGRIGYSFECWNTKADGSGENIGDGQQVEDLTTEENGIVTLYARWQPFTYRITYKDPNHFCEPESITVAYNEEVDLIGADDPKWQHEGYRLHGWTTDAIGSIFKPGQRVGKNELCRFSEDGSLSGMTMYAVWVGDGSITLTVTLDNKGVDIDPEDFVLKGEDGTIYKNCLKKVDTEPGTYMFVPATESDDGSMGGRLPEGAYNISINNCDKYGIPESSTDFTYSESEASSIHFSYDRVIIKAGDHVKDAYITDPDTGERTDQIVVSEGSSLGICAKVEKAGYHFSHYSVKGTMPEMRPGEAEQDIVVLGPCELTAHAVSDKPEKKKEFTITYDLNGGTLDGKSGKVRVKCHEGDVITIPKAPTRKGYDFNYWKGSKLYPGDKYTVVGDHVFKAIWTKNEPEPDDPDDPDSPENRSSKGDRSGNAETGDRSTPAASIAALLISLMTMIGIAIGIRRRKTIDQ